MRFNSNYFIQFKKKFKNLLNILKGNSDFKK